MVWQLCKSSWIIKLSQYLLRNTYICYAYLLKFWNIILKYHFMQQFIYAYQRNTLTFFAKLKIFSFILASYIYIIKGSQKHVPETRSTGTSFGSCHEHRLFDLLVSICCALCHPYIHLKKVALKLQLRFVLTLIYS